MNERQKILRIRSLEHVIRAGRGHSGRILSSLDLLEALYFGEENGRKIFRYDPERPQDPGRDFFVLSKIEALPGLYEVLKEAGFTLPDLLPQLPSRRIPGIEVSSDHAAYGLVYAVGMAESLYYLRSNQHVFCLVGDYELKQGRAWSAIRLAGERRLDRLCVIVDENDPKSANTVARFEAFGWKVIKLIGAHDHDDIVFAYMRARVASRRPTCIVAKTVKSKGVPFAERKPEYDDAIFSDVEMNEIRNILL